MKRIALWTALLLAVCLIWSAAAAEESAGTFTFQGVEIGPEDTVADIPGRGFVHPAEIDELLRQRPNLKTVNMWEKQFFLREIPEIFENHPDVDFGIRIELNKSHILRTDMTAYSTLGRQPQIAQMHTWYFKYLKNLKALDIGHMNVHSVDFLRETAPLKILIIADCALRDIDALSSQNELEYLEIFKNYITDLTPLSGMTELRDLNIGYNDIRDLSPLDGLQNLERLWTMGNWHLPEEEIQRFRELHPNCEVVTFSYGATGNRCDPAYKDMKQIPGTSWRHHRHYDTIHWIFDHSEYIGWDVEVPQVKTVNDP